MINHSGNQEYKYCPHLRVQPNSFHHTFPFFQVKGFCIRFYLVPSNVCRLECTPSNIEHSGMGLPYPKLGVLAQSLVETIDRAALEDLVDGMDLDNDCASSNLNLSGTQDTNWTKWMNSEIDASTGGHIIGLIPEDPISLKELRKHSVNTKERRIGLELPEGLYSTRFRARGSPDPRQQKRFYV